MESQASKAALSQPLGSAYICPLDRLNQQTFFPDRKGDSMVFHPHHKWLPLIGEWVHIHQAGVVVDEGRVEDVTEDESVLWLAAEGGKTRRMVFRVDESQVFVDYRWDVAPALQRPCSVHLFQPAVLTSTVT